jgi:5-dehydro-4-deoxyglucarate dehydratase
VALRNQGHGYAVSLVKAGATLVGHSAGPVRPPPSEMKASEIDQLGQLLSRLGPQ